MKFLFDYNMKELEPGDQISCKGIKATIKEIKFQDYYAGDYHMEFTSTDGVYRSWKSVYDGGFVTPHRTIINSEAKFNEVLSCQQERILKTELSEEEFNKIKNRFYEEMEYVKRFQNENPELTYGDFVQYRKNLKNCYELSLPVLSYIYNGNFRHIEKYLKETKNL